jgi:hypothetical protein
MQKYIGLTVVLILSLLQVSAIQAQTSQNPSNSETLTEVLYFHATGRCSTCLAVDGNTQKYLEENFKTEMQTGIIKFESVDFDETEGKILADKYYVKFSTLLIIKKETPEIITDFTNEGFKYAETEPEKYKELLFIEIQKNLR